MDTIEMEKFQPLLTTLCNVGDLPESERGFMIPRDSFQVLYQIAFNLLKREPNVERRASLLLNAIPNSSGIFLPVRLVTVEIIHRKENPSTCILFEGTYEELKQACLVKLEHWSKTDKFSKHPRFHELLFCWKKLDSAKALECVGGLLKTGDGVIDFLNANLASLSTDEIGQFLLNAGVAMEGYIPLDKLSEKVREFDLKSQNSELITKYDKAVAAVYQFKKEHYPGLDPNEVPNVTE